MMNEIQKSMREDIRNMKRIGNNIKHMKGKRGIVGTMYDPNRGLTEKQIKKKYETGEVKVYNMEKILHKDEFKYLADRTAAHGALCLRCSRFFFYFVR